MNLPVKICPSALGAGFHRPSLALLACSFHSPDIHIFSCFRFGCRLGDFRMCLVQFPPWLTPARYTIGVSLANFFLPLVVLLGRK